MNISIKSLFIPIACMASLMLCSCGKTNEEKADELLERTASEYLAPEEAIELLEEAEKIAPDYAPIFVSRGILFQQMEKFNEALSNFNKAIELDPSNNNAISLRGFLLVNLEKYEEAVKDLENVIKANPSDPAVYYITGTCYKYLAEADNNAASKEKKNSKAKYLLNKAKDMGYDFEEEDVDL